MIDLIELEKRLEKPMVHSLREQNEMPRRILNLLIMLGKRY
jgi:hypothetical protein